MQPELVTYCESLLITIMFGVKHSLVDPVYIRVPCPAPFGISGSIPGPGSKAFWKS